MSSAILIGSKNGKKLLETCFARAKEKARAANGIEYELDKEKKETREFHA